MTAQGRQKDRPRQSDPPPPAPQFPLTDRDRTTPRRGGGKRTAPPPPRRRTPRKHRPAHKGARDPEPGTGTKKAGHPQKEPNQGTGAGNAEGHKLPATAPPVPCTGTARRARATPTRRGEGVRRGARAHTHATDTQRGPKGQPDRARGMQGPHGMAYRQAKGRDTLAGQPATPTARDARAERSPGGEARTGTGPDPPDLPRAPRTHGQGTATAKAVVAHSAAHQPRR